MFEKLRKLYHSKIQITIVYPAEGVRRHTSPKVILQEAPKIVRRHQSNYRFVEEYKCDHHGKENTYWVTEEYVGGRWSSVSDTLSCNKETAIENHVKLVEGINMTPVKKTTVMWEGLDVEETKSWVALSCKT